MCLQSSLQAVAKEVVGSCISLVQALVVQRRHGKDIPPMAERAIHCCDVAKAAPLSNRVAIGRIVRKVASPSWTI